MEYVITANGFYWTGKGFGKSLWEAKYYSSFKKARQAVKAAKKKLLHN